MPHAVTRGVRVEVECEYSSDRSNPERDYYFFAYHVTISNQGDSTVQLLSRHWIITDSNGKREEVRGPGVVGEQPVLEPGQSFEYTSFCPLSTPMGAMQGTYQMATKDGENFEVQIPTFSLIQEKVTLH